MPRIVVCVEGGIVQQILTDGTDLDVEMYVHDVDRDGRPDISVTEWSLDEREADDLDPYCRPHGIMAREVGQRIDNDCEMLVAVEERVTTEQGLNCAITRYYPVVDLGDSPNHPFCIFTIDQSRAIDIREEDLR
jgi:hypothetical protein